MALFFDPRGRIGRGSFWLGWFLLWLAWIIVIWLPGVRLLAVLVITYSSVCIYTKRLRDMGTSPWWLAAPWGATLATWVLWTGAWSRQGARIEEAADTMSEGRFITPDAMIEFVQGFAPGLAMTSISLVGWLVFTIWVGAAVGQTGR